MKLALPVTPSALWIVENLHFACRNQIPCPYAAKLATQSCRPPYATAFRRKTRVANQGAVSCCSTFTAIWIVVTYSSTKYSVTNVACSSCHVIRVGQYVHDLPDTCRKVSPIFCGISSRLFGYYGDIPISEMFIFWQFVSQSWETSSSPTSFSYPTQFLYYLSNHFSH